MSPASAPAAPGRLGDAIDVVALRSYLVALDGWLDTRRAELEALDEAVRASRHCDELTPDIALGLQLWQAIQTRYRRLLQVWDRGRVTIKEREQLASLIWGRLDDAWGGLAASGMSLPEACRMSDALTGQLRSRLQLDPAGTQAIGRLRDLRASMERLRDQVGLEPAQTLPAAQARLAQFEERLSVITEKAGRGGDIGGLLGPLEADTATFERDLIVGGVLRRQPAVNQPLEGRAATPDAGAAGQSEELAGRLRTELTSRGQRLEELVDRLAASIPNPPKYAVPDVAALGPVPVTGPELDAYLVRLRRVGEAMDKIDQAYAEAVRGADHQTAAPQAGDELALLRAEAQRLGLDHGLLALMFRVADELAALNPPSAAATAAQVAACRHQVDWLTGRGAEEGPQDR